MKKKSSMGFLYLIRLLFFSSGNVDESPAKVLREEARSGTQKKSQDFGGGVGVCRGTTWHVLPEKNQVKPM